MSTLIVKKCGINPSYSRLFCRHLERQPRAWRVVVGDCGAIAIAFEREQDASRSKAALDAAGLNTPRALLAAGHEEVERVIAEAQQW